MHTLALILWQAAHHIGLLEEHKMDTKTLMVS
jgi:hypothetical protein